MDRQVISLCGKPDGALGHLEGYERGNYGQRSPWPPRTQRRVLARAPTGCGHHDLGGFALCGASCARIDAGKEASYLRMMVLNGARSKLRKRRVRRLHTPDAPGLVAAAEESGVASAERDRILAAVRQLSEKQASVIILRYYLDLSEAEIAETLGMARGSVKSHAHRGLAKLESILGEGGLR